VSRASFYIMFDFDFFPIDDAFVFYYNWDCDALVLFDVVCFSFLDSISIRCRPWQTGVTGGTRDRRRRKEGEVLRHVGPTCQDGRKRAEAVLALILGREVEIDLPSLFLMSAWISRQFECNMQEM
jgi:hypothetical protein